MSARIDLRPVVYPLIEPAVTCTALKREPFPVACAEIRWFFFYTYPSGRLSALHEARVTRPARVHGRDCYEVHYRVRNAAGALLEERFHYATVENGYVRVYGWCAPRGDVWEVTTWRDPHFNHDWRSDPGEPVRVVDAGNYRWEDPMTVDPRPRWRSYPDSSTAGAGVWRLTVGGTSYTCLRVLEGPDPTASRDALRRQMLVEAFVTPEGRTILARRYNGPAWPDGQRDWAAHLAGAPILRFKGVPFSLWLSALADDAFHEL